MQPLLAGRARFRALAEAGMAGLGAADPAFAATAVMAVCEGLITHRIAVDLDAPVPAVIDGGGAGVQPGRGRHPPALMWVTSVA